MSLRGWPDPGADEPQHAVIGSKGQAILDVLGLPYWFLEPSAEHLATVRRAAMDKTGPAFVLVPKGTIAPAPAGTAPGPAFGRSHAIAALRPYLAGALVLATTGYIGRELYGQADADTNFYMQGSMGRALALGLGTALGTPDRRVVVIDGDGAVLMHQGTCVTVGAAAPATLTHTILDNGTYESTGGQATASGRMDWVRMGAAAGYRSSTVCASAAALAEALRAIAGRPGPHLVVAKTQPEYGAPRPESPPH